MTTGLIALHACLALTVLLVLLARHLQGARERPVDALLGVLWVVLLAVAFLVFGWRAGVLAIGLSFLYGWFLRPLAWYLGWRFRGRRASAELIGECARLFMSGIWMLTAVSAGWLLESETPFGRTILKVELVLALPLWAEALHERWRMGRRDRWIRSIAWSGLGAGLATEGVVTLARQLHALVKDQTPLGCLSEGPASILFCLAVLFLLMTLSIFIARLGFGVLSDTRRA